MKFLVIGVLLVALGGGVVLVKFTSSNDANQPAPVQPSVLTTPKSATEDTQLSARLKKLSDESGGKVSVAVLHLESGKTAESDGATELPLYSVFKLPLAIVVLKDVEEQKLKLDQKVHIGRADVISGWKGNTDRWQKPTDLTVKELIGLSIMESDNTSSDKLLELVGGPKAVTDHLLSLDLPGIEITTTIKGHIADRSKHNLATAAALVKLLERLQHGDLLQASQTQVLMSFMEQAKTGLHRLRGNLPVGTIVADKTGSGETSKITNSASSTNDVGIINLPNGRGHLAIAVLLRDAKLSDEQQEKLIADLARAAFDHFNK